MSQKQKRGKEGTCSMVLGQRLSKGTTSIWNVDFFFKIRPYSIKKICNFYKDSSYFQKKFQFLCSKQEDSLCLFPRQNIRSVDILQLMHQWLFSWEVCPRKEGYGYCFSCSFQSLLFPAGPWLLIILFPFPFL